MANGSYIYNPCEWAGKPPGERFKVPADEIGVALMKQHLREEHPTDAGGEGRSDAARPPQPRQSTD